MADSTKIGWCDATFNPWIGCAKVSEGCKFCYAERDFDLHYKKAKWGPSGTRVLTSESNWQRPIRWNREVPHRKAGPYRVFCASLCDIFEDWQGEIKNHHGDTMMICPNRHIDGSVWDVTPESIECSHECGADMRPMTMDDVRARLFQLIDATPNLTWIVLTKRPENIHRMWPKVDGYQYLPEAGSMNDYPMFHRPNVILGTSCENQEAANERVPHLLTCKPIAAKLFLSCEPLLGPIDLRQAHRTKVQLPNWPNPTRVDWLIAGCESGAERRPMQLEWCESMLNACREKGVAFFMKQLELGGQVVTDVNRFPELLRVQEFPK